jgi:hypothetical protein
MTLLTLISYVLIALLLVSMLSKARPYRRLTKPGRTLASPSVSIRQRFIFYRASLLALGTAVVFGSIARWLAPSLAAIVSAFAIAIVFMPMRFTITTAGLAIGEAAFHPWTDIRDATEEKGQLCLRFASSIGRLTLPLSPAEANNVLMQICRQKSV